VIDFYYFIETLKTQYMNAAVHYFVDSLKSDTQEIIKEFDNRAEEAKQCYHAATQFPRKLKKQVRKKATKTYVFYKEQVEFLNSTWPFNV
jgi:hypothetical protein